MDQETAFVYGLVQIAVVVPNVVVGLTSLFSKKDANVSIQGMFSWVLLVIASMHVPIMITDILQEPTTYLATLYDKGVIAVLLVTTLIAGQVLLYGMFLYQIRRLWHAARNRLSR